MKILKSLLAVCIGLLICDTHASKHHKNSHKTENVDQKEHKSRHHKSHKSRVHEESFKSDRSGSFGAYKQTLEEKAVEKAESTDGNYTE